MRADDIGFFWERIPVARSKSAKVARVLPETPETGWRPPTSFPDLSAARQIAIDVETKDLDLQELGPGVRRHGHIVGLAVGTEDGGRWYFPMRHEVEAQYNLDPDQVMAWARDALAGSQPKVGANLLYDMDFLEQAGVRCGGPWYDVQIAEPLLDENRRTYALDALGRFYLGEGKVYSDLEKWSKHAYGDANYRANIWRTSPRLVGPYGEGDADLPLRILERQLPALQEQSLEELWQIETDLLPMLLAMRRFGVRVDLVKAQALDDELTQALDSAHAKLKAIAGFKVNVNASADLKRLFDAQGVSYPKTAKGAPSFIKEWLEHHPHPACAAIVEARKLAKYRDTFIRGYIFKTHINGRIHCLFHPLRSDENGTVSGRFCVHGDTRLQTSAGIFKIRDYRPTGHDTILTHRGRQRRILRRIFKGYEAMFRVSTPVGTFTATGGHRILTPEGWSNVRDLTPGSRVLCQRPELPYFRGSEKEIRAVAASLPRDKKVHSCATVQRAEENPVLALQDWRQEPNLSKNRGAASQLEGRMSRWAWLPNREAQWSSPVQASFSYVPGAQDKANSQGLVCTSPGRKQTQQFAIQPCVDDFGGACLFTSCPVLSINPVGASEVWDLEVEEDHSYVAEGVVHHNSSSLPNLQNIPIRDEVWGPKIRALFIPEEGCEWVRHDWSQIEYRFLAHFGVGKNAEEVREQYRNDPSTDFHKLVMALTGLERKPAKNVNFGLVYGMGKETLAATLDMTVEQASREVFEVYHSKVPFVKDTYDYASQRAQSRGYVKTFLKRRARFNMFTNGDYDQEKLSALPEERAREAWGPRIKRAFTHKALNRVLQGSAADLMKKAMRDIWRSGVYQVLPVAHLTVHDELDHSRPLTPEAEEAITEVKHLMQTALTLRVPVIAEEERGPSWGECR